ncbi:hypothetical protein HKBW3S34_02098, partial [Candidatus Hakubella thermalkaliphila]
SGYDAQLLIQPASALLGLRLLMSAIPIAALALAFVFIFYYPLSGERLKAVEAEMSVPIKGMP